MVYLRRFENWSKHLETAALMFFSSASSVVNKEWYYFQMEIVGTPGKFLYIYI